MLWVWFGVHPQFVRGLKPNRMFDTPVRYHPERSANPLAPYKIPARFLRGLSREMTQTGFTFHFRGPPAPGQDTTAVHWTAVGSAGRVRVPYTASSTMDTPAEAIMATTAGRTPARIPGSPRTP